MILKQRIHIHCFVHLMMKSQQLLLLVTLLSSAIGSANADCSKITDYEVETVQNGAFLCGLFFTGSSTSACSMCEKDVFPGSEMIKIHINSNVAEQSEFPTTPGQQ
jgi:hypothetical protein